MLFHQPVLDIVEIGILIIERQVAVEVVAVAVAADRGILVEPVGHIGPADHQVIGIGIGIVAARLGDDLRGRIVAERGGDIRGRPRHVARQRGQPPDRIAPQPGGPRPAAIAMRPRSAVR